MKRIDTPTKPGLYGNSTEQWTYIDFVVVYRNQYKTMEASGPLRSKVVGSTHLGLSLADHGANCEWYALSCWDRLKLSLAQMFGKHDWPKRTLRVKKPK